MRLFRWFKAGKQESPLSYPLVLVKEKGTNIVLQSVTLKVVKNGPSVEISAEWWELPQEKQV